MFRSYEIILREYVCTLLKSLDYLKIFKKFDPCGAMQRIAPQGSQRIPATCIAAITLELTVEILNSVF